jgi:hypothetical protein
MHNHRGSFYNRNTVFANMGYDDFTSVDYMSYVQKNEHGWEKDSVLTDEIVSCVENTDEKDYIYAISVQGHGEYSNKKFVQTPKIRVSGKKSEGMKTAYEYYLQQLSEMDDFIKELITELKNIDEETVLVLYGDHLPGIGLENKDMASGSITKTEYVLWSNFDIKKGNKDIDAYQLSAYVQKKLGMQEGILTTFHQEKAGTKNYRSNLKNIQYDMLYGEGYIYMDQGPPKKTDMQMGFKKISIEKIIHAGNSYYIKGKNFTTYSEISLDGKILKTTFLSPEILRLNSKVKESDVSKLKVAQSENGMTILSTTE